jgi:predicted N-acetyltransferase YhbS
MNTQIHSADKTMLGSINSIIESAVLSWDLPDRVKRLTLPSYRYTELDMQHLELMVAITDQTIVGVVAWEQADSKDTPEGKTGLLLHGIYVDPKCHRQGIGTRLFQAAERAVREKRQDGLLVRAQAGAEGFFVKQGMIRLPVDDPKRHYANRYWKPWSVT